MGDIEIRRIGASRAEDARLPNEDFLIWGRMIPSLSDGKWSYTTVHLPEPAKQCFPDEDYDVTQDSGVFLGAYDGDICIGLALLRRDMFRYLYLEDLKVCRAHRGRGAGRKLIEACMEEARRENLRGVYTIAQDDNLSACLFYLRCGFEIGGFDNRVYGGTSAEGEADIYFYRDLAQPHQPGEEKRGG